MRLLSFSAGLFSLSLAGCTGTSDSGPVDSADADTDTDADSDTDTDTDTDEQEGTATISGSIRAYDGSTPSDVEIQACVTTCFSSTTDATGAFSFTGMDAGEYKVDVVGEGVDGKDYGRMRVQGIVDDGGAWVSPGALFMPQMFGPTSINSSGTFTFGAVSWTVDPSILTIPFGYDAGMYSVGVVDGAEIGPFWSVTPSLAVAFGPLATEVAGSFDITVSTDVPAGQYDVYSVGLHGDLEGPVGTGTASGTSLTATGLTPELLTWLLFVPQS